MSLSCSAKTIKYILFVFNLAIVITGIVLLSVGITVKAYYDSYDSFLDDEYFSVANLLIAIGVIIFVIAFFGCCGAVKENYCMTITFSILLILVFILQLAAGIAGYALRNSTTDFLTTKLNESIVKYSTNNSEMNEITAMWDTIQTEFNCCGASGPGNWKQNEEFSGNELPMSCCSNRVGAVGKAECTTDDKDGTLRKNGCVSAFGDFVKNHAVTLGGVGIGFAVVQVLGILFACHLSKQIKENHYME